MIPNAATPATSSTLPKEMLIEDLRHVVVDAENLLRATANQAGEGAAAARARIQDSLKTAKARLATAQGSIMERTRDAAKAADQFAHENPWKLFGIAAVTGTVIGMLITRR